jgi:glycosyltransferase involved in cell wall biosynthesis
MRKEPIVIVILYTDLASYFLACIEFLQDLTGGTIHIFKNGVKDEAPFTFKDNNSSVLFHDESEFTPTELKTKIRALNPDIIYCAGWSNLKYIRTVYSIGQREKSILGFDNKWEGNGKQKVLAFFSKIIFTRLFKQAFVPGSKQKEFATKLGFKEENIFLNAYSADYDFFRKIGSKTMPQKKKLFPRKFLFVGRYIPIKGIYDLWEAFSQIQEEEPNNWELWSLGSGIDFGKRIIHPKIKHFGFIQPDDFQDYLADTGVYILPSHFEPWGVSVHEMAASGFPMILSDEIGSAEVFLDPEENGYIFRSGNIAELKAAMKKIISMSDTELYAMSDHSLNISSRITPEVWAKSLLRAIAE